MNAIRNLQTVEVPTGDGPLIAVMIGVDIPDAGRAEEIVAGVAETFKTHRMLCPPDTAGLCVSIIGGLSAAEFARRWSALAESDPVLGLFMSRMRAADVLRGTPAGEVLEAVSLLPTQPETR